MKIEWKQTGYKTNSSVCAYATCGDIKIWVTNGGLVTEGGLGMMGSVAVRVGDEGNERYGLSMMNESDAKTEAEGAGRWIARNLLIAAKKRAEAWGVEVKN